MNQFRKNCNNFIQAIKSRFQHFGNPFSISCFDDTRKEISRLSPEDKERIRKKIEEM